MNDNARARIGAALALGLALAAIGTAGCSDDGNTTSSNGEGGAGGTGGAGGAGGTGGAGGGGGSNIGACLDPSTHAGMFQIKDASLCVVAFYEVDGKPEGSPTWGRHGGPLTVSPVGTTGAVKITRWTPPAGATGKLTAASMDVAAAIPASAYVGSQAIDLPFFDWTAISYTGNFPDTAGEVILLDGAKVAARYPVNGFFAGAAVGGEGALGRLLYTGLSPLGDAAEGAKGLYAADACGAPGAMPRLLPEGDASCAAPLAVTSFKEFSGPVTVDRLGNAFVVLSSFKDGDQEARGIAAEKIARGAGPTAGDSLFTLPGYSGSLAALAPDAASAGILAFQSFAPDALDVVGQKYRVEGGVVQAEGAPAPLFSLTIPGTALSFFNDDQDRIWIADPMAAGGVAFAVVARAPKP